MHQETIGHPGREKRGKHVTEINRGKTTLKERPVYGKQCKWLLISTHTLQEVSEKTNQHN